MPNFVSGANGELGDLYLTSTELVDRFVGNRLWLWGSNTEGELGDDTAIQRSSPVQTVSGGTDWRSVSAGYLHTTAIKNDGSLWLWGANGFGQLGTDDLIHRSSPIQTVSGGTDWRQVSAGAYHTTAIKTDGTLWSWGINDSGQLGTNDITHRSSPVQTVSGGTDWRQVSAGLFHTAAIKTDGTLWLWGFNDFGRLGDDTTTQRSSPVQTVSGGTDWQKVSAGNLHTAAIKIDGTLWLWGSNDSGRLGTDDITDRSSPIQTVSGGTNWRQVSAGSTHTAAIKTDGTLWTWGNNDSGQLGTNDITHRSSPIQTVSGGNNWRQISAEGFGYSAAIKTDGTLWLWGRNNNGRLGDDTVTHRSSPIQTVSGGTNWQQVSGGGLHTAARRMVS